MLQKQKKLILTEAQREAMRRSGRVNARLMDFLRPHVHAGTTTLQLDEMAHQWTIDNGHIPATLGYQITPRAAARV